MANNQSALVRSSEPGNFQIKYKLIPISKYKMVHTGPNNQFGGLKNGLFRLAYQVGISETVKIPPSEPNPTIKMTEITSFCVELICMLDDFDS